MFPTVLSAGSSAHAAPAAPGDGSIANSLRFRSSASAYLNRTYTSNVTWTFSAWVKRGSLGSIKPILGNAVKFNANDTLTAVGLTTTAVYRDPSAWYHIVVSNSGCYVNGISIGSVTTSALTNASIGSDGTNYFDGYLTEVNFIDGQALDASAFGELDAITGVWKPKKYTGTYGTNGFYLDFKGGTSTTTLGKDASGNGNNWTTNNISLTAGSTYDWMLDSPTNYDNGGNGVGNYAVLNPLYTGRSTLSNANLTASGSTDLPTIVPDSGNWYFEIDGVSKNWTPPAAFPAAAGNYNFGQRPFANSVTSGYKALNTQNLPAASIVNGASFMAATTYTGTGSAQTISNAKNGVSFQPDFVWIKSRSAATDHKLTDSVRGTTKALVSNSTAAETTDTNGLTAFNSSGFSIGTDSVYNTNAATYIAWQWKANSAPVANTAGSITSQVSANTTAGFSVVTYTGNGTSGATIGHGLGVAPKFMIVKSRSSVTNWYVYSASLPEATYYLALNATDAQSNTNGSTLWNSTAPTTSLITLGNSISTNASATNYVIYSFAAIPGYSAFGSYTGNGSADGPFVFLGFRPRYVLIKRTDVADAWYIEDSSRNTYNVTGFDFQENTSNAEINNSPVMDFLATGIKIRNTYTGYNVSGGTYIYAAFAENPLQNALAR